MSLITSFISENSNWETLLASEPYFLRIKRDEDYPGLVLFKYREGKSDFRNPIVREARGLILDENDDYRIVCRSFDKFFANDETEDLRSMIGSSDNPEKDVANWSQAYGVEKIDGSLIRLYFWEGAWRASTKGMINVDKAPISGMKYTFGDLLSEVLDLDAIPSELDTDMTHMFEITSPNAPINIRYEDTELTYIISRHNESGEYEFEEDAAELPLKQGQVLTPKTYKLSSLQSALDIVSGPSFNNLSNEGIVVYDNRGPRMKVKTPLYTNLKNIRRNLTRKCGYANYMGMAKLILQDPSVVEYIERRYRSPWATKYLPLLRELREHIESYLVDARQELKAFERYLSKKEWRKDQVRRYINKYMTDRKLAWSYYDKRNLNVSQYYQNSPGLGWLVHHIRPNLETEDPGPAPKINYPSE